MFKGSSKLHMIKMNGNDDLTELPGEIFVDQVKLRTLDLSCNAISTLHDDVFKGLGNLTRLDLSKNRLTDLSRWVMTGGGGSVVVFATCLRWLIDGPPSDRARTREPLPKVINRFLLNWAVFSALSLCLRLLLFLISFLARAIAQRSFCVSPDTLVGLSGPITQILIAELLL